MPSQRLIKLLILATYLCPSFSWLPCSSAHRTLPYGRSSFLCSSPMDNWNMPPDEIEDMLNDFVDEDGNRRLSDEELEGMLGDWDDRVAQLNTVHLVGRVGNMPEPRYFEDGKVVVNLSLANKRKYHYMDRQAQDLKSGEDETDWYRLEIWGQTAEFVTKYVDKGARVGVVGTLQIDEWNDKETGEKRSSSKVIVREFDILESRAEANLRRGNSQQSNSYYGGQAETNSGASSSYTNYNDDQYSPSDGVSGGFFDD